MTALRYARGLRQFAAVLKQSSLGRPPCGTARGGKLPQPARSTPLRGRLGGV